MGLPDAEGVLPPLNRRSLPNEQSSGTPAAPVKSSLIVRAAKVRSLHTNLEQLRPCPARVTGSAHALAQQGSDHKGSLATCNQGYGERQGVACRCKKFVRNRTQPNPPVAVSWRASIKVSVRR